MSLVKYHDRKMWRKLNSTQRNQARKDYIFYYTKTELSKAARREKVTMSIVGYLDFKNLEDTMLPLDGSELYINTDLRSLVACHQRDDTGTFDLIRFYYPGGNYGIKVLTTSKYFLDMYYKIEVFKRLSPDGGFVLIQTVVNE